MLVAMLVIFIIIIAVTIIPPVSVYICWSTLTMRFILNLTSFNPVLDLILSLKPNPEFNPKPNQF